MKKHDLISYCNEEIVNSFLRDAKMNGWLNHVNNLICKNGGELQQLTNDVGSLQVDELCKYFNGYKNTVILTEKPLNNQDDYCLFNDTIVLSTAKIKNTSLAPSICLVLEKWALKDNSDSSLYPFKVKDIEEICSLASELEERVSQANDWESLVKILLLKKLLEKNNITIAEIFKRSPGRAIKDLALSIEHPLARVAATGFLIDEILKPGTVTRTWLGLTANKVRGYESEIKGRYKPLKDNILKQPFLITNRHWNSWTPTQPRASGEGRLKPKKQTKPKTPIKNHGGGYLLSDGETIIAIDPGYGFSRSIYNLYGISVMDINAIIVSHDHPDHSADFHNILALRFVYKSECEKPLMVFLNHSSFYLNKPIIEYYKESILDSSAPVLLSPGSDVSIGNIHIRSMAMFHREIYDFAPSNIKKDIGGSYALGFDIHGRSLNGAKFRIALPGDTSFPTDQNDIQKIYNFYGMPRNGPGHSDSGTGQQKFDLNRRIDIAAIHIGSLEKDWSSDCCPQGIEYGRLKHLGLNGVIKFINLIQPKVSTITEYGEELNIDDSRLSLNEIIISNLIVNNPIVIPADSTLFLVINENNVFFKCSCSIIPPYKFVPVEKLITGIGKNTFIEYSFPSGCASGLEHITL